MAVSNGAKAWWTVGAFFAAALVIVAVFVAPAMGWYKRGYGQCPAQRSAVFAPFQGRTPVNATTPIRANGALPTPVQGGGADGGGGGLAAVGATPGGATLGSASSAARMQNYSTALSSERASREAALAATAGSTSPWPQPTPPVVMQNLPPGASEHEHFVHARAAAVKQKYGLQDLPAGAVGTMPPMIGSLPGGSLAHGAMTAIKNTSDPNAPLVDSTAEALREYAPEDAARLDKALSLSGVPPSFTLGAVEADIRRRTNMVEAMFQAGNPDPTLEDILGAASPFVATRDLLRRAVAAQDKLDRSQVIQAPLRFINPNPAYRPAVPATIMGVIPPTTLTAGQQFYLDSMACETSDKPIVQENY